MATLYRANGGVEKVVPENGKSFTLRELQGYVDGYIELIRTHDGKIMMINEEGKLLGLPVNETATALYQYGDHDAICGDAVVGTDTEMGEGDEEERVG